MDLEAIKKGICTGCTACLYACPNSCISMQMDDEGFDYPVIDQEVCSNCNACNTICPAIKSQAPQDEPQVYAAVNRDETVRERSTSGGVFTELSRSVLQRGGVVYGASFDDGWMVRHERIDNLKDLTRLQGSKYLQSRLDGIFDQVQTDLNDGREVLFSGTSCQIDGLQAVLSKEYDNLLTCSVVCHGVPSPGVFKKYLAYVKDKVGTGISHINFRKKQPSWRHYSLTFEGMGGKTYRSPVNRDAYMKGFISGLFIRPSCHNCPSKPGSADLVLGDYWGVEHYHQELDDDRGTSAVIINTPKGKAYFDAIASHLKAAESTLSHAVEHNPAILHSAKPAKERRGFFEDYKEQDFDFLYKKYLRPETRFQYIKRMIKRILANILRR